MSIQTRFNVLNDLSLFTILAEKQPFDIDVIVGKYRGNGKSLLNLISLNAIQRDVEIVLHGTEEQNNAFEALLRAKGLIKTI